MPAPAAAATRDGRWRQDIAWFTTEVPRQVPEAFTDASHHAFDAAADALAQRVPHLADHEIVLELCRVAAALPRGSVRVDWPDGSGPLPAFGSLPLQLRAFPEGVYAIRTTSHGAVALGGRLLSIGEVPADELIRRASTFVNGDDDAAMKEALPRWLTTPEVLHAIGAADTTSAAYCLFTRPPAPPDDGPPPGFDSFDTGEDTGDGDDVLPPPDEPVSPTVELPLATMRAGNRYDWKQSPDTPPLGARHAERACGLELLDDGRVVYAQLNACRDAPEMSFADFTRAVLAALDAARADGPPARLVLDLRHGDGGDTERASALLDGLHARHTRGALSVAVLIGTLTSAPSRSIAERLRRDAGARLFGEPVDATPASSRAAVTHAPAVLLELPNSRLRVECVRADHHADRHADPAAERRLEPDVLVIEHPEDWFAGRDAALDAARADHP